MITTIFSKTRPFNYILIAVMLVLSFILYGIGQDLFLDISKILVAVACFLLFCTAILVASFIGIKNSLTKNNTYTILFCFLFAIMFPQIFNNWSLVFANLLILLALRRLVAVQSLKNIKQKIFDASMLIFLATLFEFWTIVFIFLVFVIILFYAPRDYRNWIIPSIALAATVILFVFFSLQFDKLLLENFIEKQNVDTNLNYFSNTFQNISFSFYCTISVLFVTNSILTYSKKPLTHQALFRFIILAFIIAMLIFVISPEKNNSFLIFTFAPLAIMSSNFFENLETYWMAETSAILITILAIICFLGQIFG